MKPRSNLARAMFVAGGVVNTGSLSRSTWLAGGSNPAPVPPVAIMSFPTLDASNDHLQLTTDANSSYVMVANDDATKCIVIDSFEASWHDAAATTQPKALFGTLAQEGETDDLVVWMCSHISGNFTTSSPIKLAPAKDLIHYNIKGPGQGGTTQPCFLKLSYHLVDA